MELLAKITAKQLAGGNVKTAPDGEIFKVVGNATGIEEGESNYGTFYGLLGDFLATTPDGKEFKSGKCFLPDTALNLIKGPLMEGNPVQFGFVIGKKPDDSSPAGYVFTVENLFESKEEDPLKTLMNTATKAIGTGKGKK